MIVEDCSTSWSSDDDDDDTTRSLDKIDDDATSDANDGATPCTLDGDDDGSCSGYESYATASSPSSPHCFMSQGDTKGKKIWTGERRAFWSFIHFCLM